MNIFIVHVLSKSHTKHLERRSAALIARLQRKNRGRLPANNIATIGELSNKAVKKSVASNSLESQLAILNLDYSPRQPRTKDDGDCWFHALLDQLR